MNTRNYLIYLAVKLKGNWEDIFAQVVSKDSPQEDYEKFAEEYLANTETKAVTFCDKEYPEYLKNISKAPLVLFYRGDISILKNRERNISVVGSRKPSYYGRASTYRLVGDLCKEMVIVSGLACGIDSCAHKAALKNNGKTVAVLGCGIDKYYIESNKELLDNIIKKGLVISEYPDGVNPEPSYFPKRNRIIAGLSKCLLIPEGRLKSGTEITAMLMLEKEGRICCVPTHIGQNSLCNSLISDGARLVETAEDVYDEIGLKKEEPLF